MNLNKLLDNDVIDDKHLDKMMKYYKIVVIEPCGQFKLNYSLLFNYLTNRETKGNPKTPDISQIEEVRDFVKDSGKELKTIFASIIIYQRQKAEDKRTDLSLIFLRLLHVEKRQGYKNLEDKYNELMGKTLNQLYIEANI